jgi:hypothetical protein
MVVTLATKSVGNRAVNVEFVVLNDVEKGVVEVKASFLVVGVVATILAVMLGLTLRLRCLFNETGLKVS